MIRMILQWVACKVGVLLNLDPWKLRLRNELSIVSLACGVEGAKLVAACSMFRLHGVSKFGVL